MYGLNYKIRAAVRMWKPYSVAMAVEYGRYAEDMSDAKKRIKLIGSS